MPEVDEGGAHCTGKVGFNMGEQRRIESPWKASEERLSALLIWACSLQDVSLPAPL